MHTQLAQNVHTHAEAKHVYKTALQRNVAAVLAEMPGIGTRAKEKLQTRDRTDTKLQAGSLHLPSIKHVKRAKTAHLRASAHDYLKKTPRLGSQNILSSTTFALAQQASSREHSKSFAEDQVLIYAAPAWGSADLLSALTPRTAGT